MALTLLVIQFLPLSAEGRIVLIEKEHVGMQESGKTIKKNKGRYNTTSTNEYKIFSNA